MSSKDDKNSYKQKTGEAKQPAQMPNCTYAAARKGGSMPTDPGTGPGPGPMPIGYRIPTDHEYEKEHNG